MDFHRQCNMPTNSEEVPKNAKSKQANILESAAMKRRILNDEKSKMIKKQMKQAWEDRNTSLQLQFDFNQQL